MPLLYIAVNRDLLLLGRHFPVFRFCKWIQHRETFFSECPSVWFCLSSLFNDMAAHYSRIILEGSDGALIAGDGGRGRDTYRDHRESCERE